MIDVENHFRNCVLLSNIALIDNQSVREKSLSQGSIFTVPIFSFHVVNHKYFSICDKLHWGAIRENSTALIKMWRFLEGVLPPPTKRIEAGAAAFYPYTRKNVSTPSCLHVRKWQTPVCFCSQIECIPVIHWSNWVSVFISYIRGQNVLWDLLKSFQRRQNYNVQNNVFVEGCSSLFLESVKIHETSANHRNKMQIRNVQVAHIKGHSFYNSLLVQATQITL